MPPARNGWIARSLLVAALLCICIPATAIDHRLLWLYNTHLDEELRSVPFGTHGIPRAIPWLRFTHLFRSHRTKEVRTINPRLLRVLAQIQEHFGGARIELLSGYRTPDNRDHLSSYHQVGHAADIYIRGVSNRVLFDYCLSLVDLGCGLYPKGMHVHVDVRSRPAVWVDLSHYGDGAAYVPDARGWLKHHPDAGRTAAAVDN